mgnify:CR=1 FL=1
MQTQMETIALFPLNSVMFPKVRVSLQIFESRYVDMIRQCLRETSGFGVVLIATGSEVARSGEKLDVHRVGTYCEIVDWNQLPNGLLGITAEGRGTFQLVETWRESNQLCRAVVRFRQQDAVSAVPVEVAEEFAEYVDLLKGLSRHPAIADLKMDVSFDNLREVAWRLSDLLPIANKEKQKVRQLYAEGKVGRDELLDNVMLYWVTASAASSARLYWESFGAGRRAARPVTVPTGVAVFPTEIVPPVRRWMAASHPDIRHWTEMPRGGHFAAFEQPGLFVGEVRACFGKVR